MLILSLDTTTRAGSVAIVDDDEVLAVHAGDPTRTHGERLPGEIDAVLTAAGIDRAALDLLVVASGPGAFTGLRIGLAAMQGLAMTLGKPIIGVSALDALAWTVLGPIAAGPSAPDKGAPDTHRIRVPSDRLVATWMDAQRGEVFSALFPSRVDVEPAVGSPDAILADDAFDRAASIVFIGDGARRYASLIAAASTRWSVSAEDPPLAPALAWIGRRRAAEGHPTTPHALQPLYVRRPDAEIERDQRLRQAVLPPVHGRVRRSAEREGGSAEREGGS